MTKQDAIDYLEKVLDNWSSWHDHHKKLVDAIEVLLEEIKSDH
jgi:Txe/YoeB family toxin of Txe-Axe toxin-antitoxin module